MFDGTASTGPIPPGDSPSESGVLIAPARTEQERSYRQFEFFALFFAVPALAAIGRGLIPLWALLAAATAACAFMLLRDPTFDRRVLFNMDGFKKGILRTLGLWLVGVVVLSVIVQIMAPELWLRFPRERPGMWAIVMLGYPILSVVPQNLVYRVFMFHRYKGVFRTDNALIWASAASFCWAHVIFGNLVALLLTLAGGLIFAQTYHRHRSLPLVSLEHALYGCLLFTVGLGWYLYQGS